MHPGYRSASDDTISCSAGCAEGAFSKLVLPPIILLKLSLLLKTRPRFLPSPSYRDDETGCYWSVLAAFFFHHCPPAVPPPPPLHPLCLFQEGLRSRLVPDQKDYKARRDWTGLECVFFKFPCDDLQVTVLYNTAVE